MKGIDISNYQANFNFNTSDAEVCIIKATEGLMYTNPYLKSQYNKAKAKGMKVGFYHFLRANNAVAEAKHFLSVISGLQSDCKYIIDAEVQPVGISARIRVFADYLISQGKEPCLYTGLNFYQTEILANCKNIDLWVAKYGGSRPNVKSVGWQYSGSPLDLDTFDEEILLSGAKLAAVSPTATAKVVPKTVAPTNPKVKTMQQLCNTMGIKGSNGKALVVDGYTGTNTQFACAKLPLCGLPYVQRSCTKIVQCFIGAKVDGIFGNGTATLMKRYQKSKGLTQDGICGKNGYLSFLK